jgi:uncharacterized protein (DUF169 family)
MQSRIAEELKLGYKPVALLFADEKPEGALEFKQGTWGCVVAMFSAAARGKTAAFSAETCGCGGGRIGLGFTDSYDHVPGGIEYFLSTGRGEGYPEGEAYVKTPEIARSFVEQLPRTLIPAKYVIAKPLDEVDPASKKPELVIFFCEPDQLSALVVLANYGRAGGDNVIIPFGAGCHQTCLIPYDQSRKDMPKAVVGVTDISARPMVDPNVLSFTVPFAMFEEMEANVPGSFLEKDAWKKVRARIPEPI